MRQKTFFLFLFLFSVSTLHAEAFKITNYDISITLNENGSFQVREIIDVRFSEKRHGIFRSIPYRYRIGETDGEQAVRSTTKEGYYETLLTDVEVANHQFRLSKEDSYLKIRIGNPNKKVGGNQRYEITYTVWGALNQFNNHQEFSWNLIGHEWRTSVADAHFTINFPKTVALNKNDMLAYTGRTGSRTQDVAYDIEKKRISGRLTKPLRSREGMSLAIRFPVDYFQQTTIPAEVYADHFIIDRHQTVISVNRNTSIDVLETFQVDFLKPTSSFVRQFIMKPRQLESGGNQYGMIAEEELLVETSPNQDVGLVVSRNRGGDHITIKSKNRSFTGKVTFTLRYKIWGAAVKQGNQAAFVCEILNVAADEPVRQSAFEINLPADATVRKNAISLTRHLQRKADFIAYHLENNQHRIAGNITHPLLHGEDYEIHFLTDADAFDFSEMPLEAFMQHYFVDYFKTDVFLQKDGSATIKHSMETDFIYRSSNTAFRPYVQREYRKSDYDLPDYGLFSPVYRPLIGDVEFEANDHYELKENTDYFRFNLKQNADAEWPQPFVYQYTIKGIQTKGNGNYKINFPVIYPVDEPIRQGSFRIHFPNDIDTSKVQVLANTTTGRKVGRVDKNQNSISGVIYENLLPKEGVVVTMTYPKSYTGSSWGTAIWLTLSNNVFFLLAFLGIGLLYLLWHFLGRDEQHPLMVRFRPPADMTPAEAGMLWDGKLHKRDLIALIYHWAAKGHLHIREREGNGKSTFTLIKKTSLSNEARDYERTFFNGLFKSGDEVDISELRNSFYKTMNQADKEMHAYAKSSGYYVRGSRGVGVFLIVIGVLSAAIGLLLLGISFFQNDFSIAIPILLLAGALLFFGYFMPKKAPFGAKKFAEIIGFREFVKTAEIDRLRALASEDPKYFENTIAYAIVFGLGHQWARKFKDLALPEPDWYDGPRHGSFNPILFTDGMYGGMRQIQTDLNYVKPAPSTSSGSGGSSFGGGFSSGGGFGGGGGGSW